jgi:hypothetical protein
MHMIFKLPDVTPWHADSLQSTSITIRLQRHVWIGCTKYSDGGGNQNRRMPHESEGEKMVGGDTEGLDSDDDGDPCRIRIHSP